MQYKSKKIVVLFMAMLFFIAGFAIFSQSTKVEAKTPIEVIDNKVYDYVKYTMFGTETGKGFWTHTSKGNLVFLDQECMNMDISLDSVVGIIANNAIKGWVKIGNYIYYLTPYKMTAGVHNITEVNKVYPSANYLFGPNGTLIYGINKVNGYHYYSHLKYGYLESGWKKVNGSWYYFRPDNFTGVANTYITLDKKTYYFDKNATLITGLFKDANGKYRYGTTNGIVVNDWHKSNGYWYYCDSNGYAVTGNKVKTKDGYYNFKDYKLVTGLQKLNDIYIYVNPNSGAKVKNNWVKIDSYWWYFNDNGYAVTGNNVKTKDGHYNFNNFKLVTGFQKIDKEYVYVTGNGKMLRDTWKKINGNWYYFTNDYCAYKTGEYKIDGIYYKFKDCKLQTGIQLVKKEWHYYNPTNGVISKDRWIKSDNDWWYFDTNGNAVNGIQYIKGTVYVFKSYKLQTGLQTITKSQSSKYAGVYYYYASKGTAAKGWTKLGNIWYYFDKTGKAYTNGKYKIDNEWYYFGNTGKMQTGVIKINDSLYYFAPNGKLITKEGWHKWNNNWYYVRNTSGVLADNRTTVQSGKKSYKFDKNGVCINP